MEPIKAFCIVAFCLFYFFGNSQEPLKIKKGVINTTDGTIIKFNSLNQDGSVFNFRESGTKVNRTINQEQILSISEKTGDQMVLYALVMGISGGLGAVLGANMAEKDANAQGMTVDKNAKKNTIIVLTGISTLAGAIWGASTPKYSKVYENPEYADRFLDRMNIGISIGKETQLCLRYNF